MTAEQNERLIRGYFEVLTGTAVDISLEDFFASDIVWHLPPSNPMANPNPRAGRAAVMALLGSGVAVYRPGSIHIDLQRIIADADHVVAQFSLKAVLANGNDYDNRYLFLFSIRDGKINGVWEYLDTLYQAQRGSFDTGTTS